MAATLALLILLAGSLIIVRFASVFLRLTGLPDHVARFQSISALTGAGFTTTESEAIVNFPIRRKVIVALMLLGNLGLVSVASTIILALSEAVGDSEKMAVQAAQMLAATAVIAVFMMSKTLDSILCGAAARILRKFVSIETEHFHVLLAMGPDHCVAAHIYRGSQAIAANELLGDLNDISILALMGLDHRVGESDLAEAKVSMNETLICFASNEGQERLAQRIKQVIE
ncbi:MAG: hypothetical protein ABJ239_07630 [Erythrobacter sp.]